VPDARLARLLLPIIAALALLVQPVATWAAAGIEREAKCCCPDPDKCECHDHNGKGPSSPSMRRCDTGQVKIVAPVVLTADLPPAVVDVVDARPVMAPVAVPAMLVEIPAIPPEKPPF
jgi:hypothetical protein